MKVLQVVEATSAGVGRHVRGLGNYLASAGHDVSVAYSPVRIDEPFERFVASGRPNLRFFQLELRREISLSDVRSTYELLGLMHRHGPFDVLHGHSSKGGALARMAGLLTRTPVVYTPHSLMMAAPQVPTSSFLLYTGIEQLLGRLATASLIAVSEEERQLALKLRLVPSDRVAVVPNGLDDDNLRRLGHLRSSEPSGTDRPLVFGSIMRFDAQKAPTLLIEAFARLVESMPAKSLRLRIAGDGELMPATRQLVREHGLSERVELLGWRTDVEAVLSGFDVFVLPSLYEGFSYAVLEAMAARLPVVSTNVFGTAYTVARVPGNVVVPVGSASALADGMRAIANAASDDESALRRIGDANGEHIRAAFREAELMRGIVAVYERVCA